MKSSYPDDSWLSREDLAKADWKQTQNLKSGMRLATPNGWDVIVNVYRMGTKEPMYDVEIEDTHNFVGNDIVAHNTYLGGRTTLVGHLIPDTSAAFDLGDAVLNWREIYTQGLTVSGSTTLNTVAYTWPGNCPQVQEPRHKKKTCASLEKT